jgi:hypothetical protein
MARESMTLTCKEFVELATEFLGDCMNPEDRVRLEQHLLVCPPCTLHLGQLKATVDYAALLRTPAAPGPVSQNLLERFRKWSQKT